jgi:(1->4)-alpha-D-glucan 1-alpha-D-glucosylmutase
VACLAVYRTYIIDTPSAQDVRYVDLAIRDARRRSQVDDPSVFAFVREALLGQTVAGTPDEARIRVLRFATRFQQFSAPVAAKGVEDTAFYRYFPLSALNEVGGDPDIFGMTVPQFHEASADRARRWPHTMLATSTHDNKRSEDVRLRIDVLSEMTARWRLALRTWRALNDGLRAPAADGQHDRPPSAAHEYLFYQTVLGTLAPDGADAQTHANYVERIVRYMLKAAREGKTGTSWTQPREDYEQALEHFVREALAPRESNRFLAELRQFAATLRWYGALNSFTLVLLKYTSPGVPDLYQGNELIDDSLVDPDNRRPVDYAARAQCLDELAALAAGTPPDLGRRVAELATAPEDGRAKLWLTWRLLSLRRESPRLFRDGGYTPLDVRGPFARHVVAYMRQHETGCIVVVVARLFAKLHEHRRPADAVGDAPEPERQLPVGETAWRDTAVLLPHDATPHNFEDRLTGAAHAARDGRFALAELFRDFPGAVLVAAAPEH